MTDWLNEWEALFELHVRQKPCDLRPETRASANRCFTDNTPNAVGSPRRRRIRGTPPGTGTCRGCGAGFGIQPTNLQDNLANRTYPTLPYNAREQIVAQTLSSFRFRKHPCASAYLWYSRRPQPPPACSIYAAVSIPETVHHPPASNGLDRSERGPRERSHAFRWVMWRVSVPHSAFLNIECNSCRRWRRSRDASAVREGTMGNAVPVSQRSVAGTRDVVPREVRVRNPKCRGLNGSMLRTSNYHGWDVRNQGGGRFIEGPRPGEKLFKFLRGITVWKGDDLNCRDTGAFRWKRAIEYPLVRYDRTKGWNRGVASFSVPPQFKRLLQLSVCHLGTSRSDRKLAAAELE